MDGFVDAPVSVMVGKAPEVLDDPARLAGVMAYSLGDPVLVWAGLWGLMHPQVGHPQATVGQVAAVVAELAMSYPGVGREVFELVVTQAPEVGVLAATYEGTGAWLAAMAEVDPRPVVAVLAGMDPAAAGWVLAGMAGACPGALLAVLPGYAVCPGAVEAVTKAVGWEPVGMTKALTELLDSGPGWTRWAAGLLTGVGTGTAAWVLARMARGQGGTLTAAAVLAELRSAGGAGVVAATVVHNRTEMVPVIAAAIGGGMPAVEILAALDAPTAAAVLAGLPAERAVGVLRELEDADDSAAVAVLVAAVGSHPDLAAEVAAALLVQGRCDDVAALLTAGGEISAHSAAAVFGAIAWPDPATALRTFTAMNTQCGPGDGPSAFTVLTTADGGDGDDDGGALDGFCRALAGGRKWAHLLRALDQAGDVQTAALVLAGVANHDPAGAAEMLDLLGRGPQVFPAFSALGLLVAALEARPRAMTGVAGHLAAQGAGRIQLIAEALADPGMPEATAVTVYAGVAAAAAGGAGGAAAAGALESPAALLTALHGTDPARAGHILTRLLADPAHTSLAVNLCVWLVEHGAQSASTLAAVLTLSPPTALGDVLAALAKHDPDGNLLTRLSGALPPAIFTTALTTLVVNRPKVSLRMLKVLRLTGHTLPAATTLTALIAADPIAAGTVIRLLGRAALREIAAVVPDGELTGGVTAVAATGDHTAAVSLLLALHHADRTDQAAAALTTMTTTISPEGAYQVLALTKDITQIVIEMPQREVIEWILALGARRAFDAIAGLLNALHHDGHADTAAGLLSELVDAAPESTAEIIRHLDHRAVAELLDDLYRLGHTAAAAALLSSLITAPSTTIAQILGYMDSTALADIVAEVPQKNLTALAATSARASALLRPWLSATVPTE
ncbi:hypothetical protein ACIQMR_31565 [Streptomyces sp. NPDC091376]|uniref:hypothetical protein n=1 Tax=Streptomyces sp. NPDC091376 TaxID=3365994 RepID=UPI003829C752